MPIFCNCIHCTQAASASMSSPASMPVSSRRSRRLAAKPRIDYYEEPVPSEAQIRAADEAADRRAEAAFVRAALKAKRAAEAAVAREERRKAIAAERVIRQMERDMERENKEKKINAWRQEVAAVRAELGCSFGDALREASKRRYDARRAAEAKTETERLKAWFAKRWLAETPKRTIAIAAPPPAPKLERSNAVVDLDLPLPPPAPLRRTCQLPTCDEHCAYCRENDRIAAYNRAHPLPPPPPPTHLPVVRVPIAIGAMTAQEMSDLIAALAQAMRNK